MTTAFVAPLPFVAASASPALNGSSLSNLNTDIASMVYRCATNGAFIVDIGADGDAYDTIGLIGLNLRSTDKVRVQSGTTNTGIGGYDSGWLSWSGFKWKGATAKLIVSMASRTDRYVKVTFDVAGHPDGYAQLQRLVIGSAVRSEWGIGFGASKAAEDRSVVTQGAGYTHVARYNILPSIKLSVAGITDQEWREKWEPLFLTVGSSSGLLFVRDLNAPTTHQSDAMFGRITSKAEGTAQAYDWWTVEATIEAWGR